uniref:Structure-specific endonuclease subunit SLX4 n=1 Tax=Kwoniella bestiolae CBS 10118 TaxID=1296100 RepID=A0A1B9G5S0_9TREE|nr:hypothetical protein I302_04062 [Kwoniella bestiolae CBS 10118]OCF26379.1 hypothetical protein I302_04062 [Kwoniella bestiolae CBS 10118]
MPPPLAQHPSTSSTSSDEPVYIETPTAKAGPSTYRSRNSNAASKSPVIVGDEDEDEPVFVGSSITSLVEKYKLNPEVGARLSKSKSRSLSKSPSIGPPTIEVAESSRKSAAPPSKSRTATSSSSRKGKSKATTKTKTKQPITLIVDDDDEDITKQVRQPSLPLLPDLALAPLPVPDWLGRTAILLPLDKCVVCKIRFKKTDSGAAKWRHISTCRPPLYRPPNPPPNLKHLINEALQDQSKSSEPTSLLDLHVRRSDSMEDVSPVKGKKKSLGLKSFTSVKATDERMGDDWDNEVKTRLREFIGPSSPPPELGTPTPSPPGSPKEPSRIRYSDTEDEGKEEMYPPSTQSLGESSLAQMYAKPSISPSGSPSKSPITPPPIPPDSPGQDSISIHSQSEESDTPLPPSSQKRLISERYSSDGDDPDTDRSYLNEQVEGGLTKKPFRRWGDPRVEGDLSYAPKDDTDGSTPQKHLTPSTTHSSTPRATTRRRDQSTTPTPAQVVYSVPSSSPEIDMIQEDEWGDDALLSWDGRGDDDDEMISVSSVAPSEAGLEQEDEEEWGRDAYLEWAWDGDTNTVDEDEEQELQTDEEVGGEEDSDDDSEDEEEIVMESTSDLVRRGMPDYSTWELNKLQKLVTGYGYRTSNDHQSLEKIAMECWKAINPAPAPAPRPGKSVGTAITVGDSQESASTTAKSKGKAKEKEQPKGKATYEDLSKMFYKLIMDDDELYLRILRYEPISFDELVSKSIAAGIDREKRGWKKDLKKYLDLQSISFFSEDPTGQRRRH